MGHNSTGMCVQLVYSVQTVVPHSVAKLAKVCSSTVYRVVTSGDIR